MRPIRLFLLMCFFCIWARAQDLESLRWKNRVLLLYTNDLAHKEYKKMERSLLSDQVGVEARKLVIFTILGERVSRGLPATEWQKSVSGYTTENKLTDGFMMKLVGLDGGVKYTATTAISTAKLWAVIDGMPMRRSELRKKGNP